MHNELEKFLYTSPVMGLGVTLGNLSIWIGLACAVTCVVLYWVAMVRTMRGLGSVAPADAAGAAEAESGKSKRHLPASAKAEEASPEFAKTDRIGLWARRFFYLTCTCAVVGSLSLFALVLTQQYNVHYIWKNSNKALAFGFRFASFWSDQEGTFFLWSLYNLVLGAVLLRKARPDERWVMPFFTLINVSLFTLLCFMNPFWIHAPSEVRRELMSMGATEDMLGFLPKDGNTWQHLMYYFGWAKYVEMTDGKGLNEQLQNFWMVIHPPTLFVGYSSMIVPSCFALGALMKRDYDQWVNRAAPWLAFAWTILGIGIFLGAYWAYETLGWGGYWSWDPVENSSIIPWVVATAFIHGVLAQRARGNFKQANLFLGAFTGTSVLLGSFLVRSGVLADVSVHSFASPQKSVFITLLVMMLVWFVLNIGIWAWRYKDIQSEIAYDQVWERHFGFFLGLIVLSAMALVITFGVTLPVWKPWLGLGKTSVDYTFYNKALLPVTYVLVLLMGITPLMPWRKGRDEQKPLGAFNTATLGAFALISIFFLFAAYYAWQGGFRTHNDNPPSYNNDPAYIAFGLAIAVALVTNVVCLMRARRGGWLNTGAWFAHIGFIVMLGGVVYTSRFNTVTSINKLGVGETAEVGGAKYTYMGQRPAANPQDRDRLLIKIERNGKTFESAPKLFLSKIANQTMAWPEIFHEGWNDLYIVPQGADSSGAIALDEVKKDEPKATVVQYKRDSPTDEVLLNFHSLDTSQMQKAMQSQADPNAIPKPFMLYADVTLVVNGTEKKLRPAVLVSFTEQGLDWEPMPIPVAGLTQETGYTLRFLKSNLKPGELNASFELLPSEPVRQGYFQVLYVPGIGILWWGCYIMFFGAFLTWRNRVKLAQRGVLVKTKRTERESRIESSIPAINPDTAPAGAE